MMTAKSLLPLLLLSTLEKASAATCYPGTYTASCIPCPSGTFSSIGGAAACIPCAEGSNSPPGAAACLTRCGWVDSAVADAAVSSSAPSAMTSQTNVVCPPDHYCPDADESR
jgi:hypothetical protein